MLDEEQFAPSRTSQPQRVVVVRFSLLCSLEMCMGMGTIGIPWVPWDSHGNVSVNVSDSDYIMGMGMGVGIKVREWE